MADALANASRRSHPFLYPGVRLLKRHVQSADTLQIITITILT